MIVVVNGPAGEVQLAEAENLKGLSVELRDCDRDLAQKLLGDLGRLDGDHVWLDIMHLRALSPLSGDAEWAAGYEATMAYAASKGWLDDAGTSVRAHLA